MGGNLTKLREIRFESAFCMGDNLPALCTILNALPAASSLERLEFRCWRSPDPFHFPPEADLSNLRPGSLSKLRELSVDAYMGRDLLGPLLLAAGSSLRKIQMGNAVDESGVARGFAALLADTNGGFEPLWLGVMKELSVDMTSMERWSEQIPHNLVKGLVRLPALEKLKLALVRYDAFVVKFLTAIDNGGWGQSLREVQFVSARYPRGGHESFFPHGSLLLLLFWYKRNYHGAAQRLDIFGLPFRHMSTYFRKFVEQSFPASHKITTAAAAATGAAAAGNA